MVHTEIQEYHAIILHELRWPVPFTIMLDNPTRVCLCTGYWL
jgi:hypothetical protein